MACIAQSPVVDVVAIGLKSGKIYIHNLRTDETPLIFTQTEAVTALSFRTGTFFSVLQVTLLDEHAVLVSGNVNGQIAVWNLKDRTLQTIIKTAHEGSVLTLQFLSGEPVLVSAGSDNSLKVLLCNVTAV